MIYHYRDDDGLEETFEAAGDAGEATATARQMLLGGWHGTVTKTTRLWADVTPEGETLGWRVSAEIEPPEPACAPGGHDWEETSVQGNGGGVIVTSTCQRCGRGRIKNTWDHASDGTILETVTYTETCTEA